MEWFSKHPEWLYQESADLANDSNYQEIAQAIGKTFVSAGEIIVHKEKTDRYPILIVYPAATPYVPPTIYILKEPLKKASVETYSQLSPEEICKDVAAKVRFFYRRHQNADGSLCFLETGDLHDETAQAYRIKNIISKRLRPWLAGHIPQDSREVELYAHFRKKAQDMHILLPDNFFDPGIVTGMFYVELPNIIRSNLLEDQPFKKTYIGIFIVGKTAGGVSLPPKVCVKEDLLLFAYLPSAKSLLKEDGKIRELLDKGNLMQGFWWDINREPEPFAEVSGIARYVGNDDIDLGVNELVKALEEPLKRLTSVFIVGLRFPGRRGGLEWQMFRLKRMEKRNPLINSRDQKKELIERLKDYGVEAVSQESFTDDYFHMRNGGRSDRSILRDKAISIIGCGALGSEIADCLAKSGIGRLRFVDQESFSAHNAVRHCLGFDNIGLPKVWGMHFHTMFRNPFVFVDADVPSINILKHSIDDYLPSDMIGISSIADDNVEAFLNERAVEAGRTVYYCRALRGGKAARIFRVIPGTDACKSCLSLHRYDKHPQFVEIAEDENLPEITNECNNPVRPASAADLKISAALAARLVIDDLQSGPGRENHWIWSSAPLEELGISSGTRGVIKAYALSPHPQCPVCRKLEDRKVFIPREQYDLLKKEASESNTVETGGMLVGHRTKHGHYRILRVTGPGPKAKRTETGFEKDVAYSQKELERANKDLGKRGLYLGEWHYHPRVSNVPSGRDIQSLAEIASQENYGIDRPIMIILSPQFEVAVTIHTKGGQCAKLLLCVENPDEASGVKRENQIILKKDRKNVLS